MATTVDEILVRFLGDTRSFDRAVFSFRSNIAGLGRDISLAATAVTGLFAAAGAAASNAAGSFEQTTVAFKTMVGDVDRAMGLLDEMAQFARTTPFELRDVEEGAKKLLAMGFVADEILPTLKSVGDVVAGIGIEGGRLDRVLLNLGQVRTQTLLTSRDLRDFAVNGIPLLDVLAQTVEGVSDNLEVARGQIRDMITRRQISDADVLTAFRAMSSEGGKFANLMVKQSETFFGMISNIKDAIQIFLRGIGAELMPTIKSMASGFMTFVEMLSNTDKQTKKAIATTIAWGVALGGIVVVVGTVGTMMAVLLTSVSTAVTAFGLAAIKSAALSASLLALKLSIGGVVIAAAGFLIWKKYANIMEEANRSVRVSTGLHLEHMEAVKAGNDALMDRVHSLSGAPEHQQELMLEHVNRLQKEIPLLNNQIKQWNDLLETNFDVTKGNTGALAAWGIALGTAGEREKAQARIAALNKELGYAQGTLDQLLGMLSELEGEGALYSPEAIDSAKELNEELEHQIAVFGMSTNAAKLYALSIAGIPHDLREEIKANIDLLELKAKEKETREEAARAAELESDRIARAEQAKIDANKRAFQSTMNSLNVQLTELKEGARAAEVLRMTQAGLSDIQIKAAMAIWDEVAALRAAKDEAKELSERLMELWNIQNMFAGRRDFHISQQGLVFGGGALADSLPATIQQAKQASVLTPAGARAFAGAPDIMPNSRFPMGEFHAANDTDFLNPQLPPSAFGHTEKVTNRLDKLIKTTEEKETVVVTEVQTLGLN